MVRFVEKRRHPTVQLSVLTTDGGDVRGDVLILCQPNAAWLAGNESRNVVSGRHREDQTRSRGISPVLWIVSSVSRTITM